jgi:hypothetical protein
MRRLAYALVALSVGFGAAGSIGAGQQDEADPGAVGWIRFYTPDLIDWLENQNRIDSLCPGAPESIAGYECRRLKLEPKILVLPVKKGPSRSAADAGDIVVMARPGVGLHASYVGAGGGRGQRIEPDLSEGDWGYGPYFHLTVAERRGNWVRLPEDPFPPSTWIDATALGVTPFRRLEPGDIVTSPVGDLFVLAVEPGLVRARPEQKRDMPCDDDDPGPVAPFSDIRIEGATLFTRTGHLRLHVKYTRGC